MFFMIRRSWGAVGSGHEAENRRRVVRQMNDVNARGGDPVLAVLKPGAAQCRRWPEDHSGGEPVSA
jgi:hypothetical protein